MQPRPNKCKLNAGDRARRRFVGSAGRIAASTAAVGSGRRRSAPVGGPRTRDLWSRNRRRRAAVRARPGRRRRRWLQTALRRRRRRRPLVRRVVAAAGVGGGGGGSVGGGGAAVAHRTDVRWASPTVVARPAAVRPTGAQRNRHGNRSPLPLTNPFGTADRPLTPGAPPLPYKPRRRLSDRPSRHIIRTRLFQPFSTRPRRDRRHFLVARDFYFFHSHNIIRFKRYCIRLHYIVVILL